MANGKAKDGAVGREPGGRDAIGGELDGRTAVVTGGGSGIGAALCALLAGRGAHVYCIDRNGEAAANVCAPLGDAAVPVSLDVTNAAAFRALSKRVADERGPLHLLFNNAGVLRPGVGVESSDPAAEDDPGALLRLHFDVNVVGTANGCRALLPGMRAHGEPAHVINTASIGAFLASDEVGAYCVSKFAVRGLSEAMRASLTRDGIGLTVVCPGAVETGLFSQPEATDNTDMPERMSAALSGGMKPAEVAEKVLRGVADGRRYVFTHPEFADALRGGFDALLEDLEATSGQVSG